MAQRRKSTRAASSTRPRRKTASAGRRRRSTARPHRFGPMFFTIVAITGLCALAFLGLVASVMARAS